MLTGYMNQPWKSGDQITATRLEEMRARGITEIRVGPGLTMVRNGNAVSIGLAKSGSPISPFLYVDLVHNGGGFGTDKVTVADATFDIFDHNNDVDHVSALNGGTPIAPANAPFRAFNLEVTHADKGIAIRVSDGTYILWECNERPANVKYCTT
jgi:hypothetical protein